MRQCNTSLIKFKQIIDPFDFVLYAYIRKAYSAVNEGEYKLLSEKIQEFSNLVHLFWGILGLCRKVSSTAVGEVLLRQLSKTCNLF